MVTDAVYRQGFARYSACMTDAGYPLVFVDESGAIVQYSNTSDAIASGDEERCYASEFAQLDESWQLQARQPPPQAEGRDH